MSLKDIEKPKFPLNDTEVRNTHINIGTGKDLSIKELAELIKNEIIEFKGEIIWDETKPDGTFQKLLDVSKLHSLGWKDKINFTEGLADIYESYKQY